MRIAGLQPCSSIDFPGLLSAVVFLRGCNLRCPYCHNPGLLDAHGDTAMSRNELLAFAASRRGLLDGIVVSGGEPTLDPGLPELVASVRALGYKVKLDTNGTRPEVLQDLLSRHLLDYVAIDLKDEPECYPGWLGLREDPASVRTSIDLVKRAGVAHELRTTVLPSRHDAARLRRMAAIASGAQRWILQPCRLGGVRSSGPAELESLADAIRRDAPLTVTVRAVPLNTGPFASML